MGFRKQISEVCACCGLTQMHHWIHGHVTGCSQFVAAGVKRASYISACEGMQGCSSPEYVAANKALADRLDSLPEEPRADTLRWRMEKDLPREDNGMCRIMTLVGSTPEGVDLVVLQDEVCHYAYAPYHQMFVQPSILFLVPEFEPSKKRQLELSSLKGGTLQTMKALEDDYVAYRAKHAIRYGEHSSFPHKCKWGLKIFRWASVVVLTGDYEGECLAVAASKEDAIDLIVGSKDLKNRLRIELQNSDPFVEPFAPFGYSRLDH